MRTRREKDGGGQRYGFPLSGDYRLGTLMALRGRLIAVEGRSAAGKTTLVRLASRTLGWMPLAEAYDRLDPPPPLEVGSPRELLLLEEQLLAEEVRRYAEARRACARGRTVLADTGFLGPVTYTRGLAALGRAPVSVVRATERKASGLFRQQVLGIPDLSVYLETTVRERTRRARGDWPHRPAGLVERHEAVGEIERPFFTRAFPMAMPDRFRTLRGRPPPASLVVSLRALVAAAHPTPAPPDGGLELLAALGPVTVARRTRNVGPNR